MLYLASNSQTDIFVYQNVYSTPRLPGWNERIRSRFAFGVICFREICEDMGDSTEWGEPFLLMIGVNHLSAFIDIKETMPSDISRPKLRITIPYPQLYRLCF
jgi:hypothetical protein